MSDSLFPTPPVPPSAEAALRMAAQCATVCRRALHDALRRDTAQWSPEALAELARLLISAEHLDQSIRDLLPQ